MRRCRVQGGNPKRGKRPPEKERKRPGPGSKERRLPGNDVKKNKPPEIVLKGGIAEKWDPARGKKGEEGVPRWHYKVTEERILGDQRGFRGGNKVRNIAVKGGEEARRRVCLEQNTIEKTDVGKRYT